MVALGWNESDVILAPADFSMSLSAGRKSPPEVPEKEIDADRAIDDLKKIVDDLEFD